MALIISGQVHHRHLSPSEVKAALQRRIPHIQVGGDDFLAEMRHCRVEFFCNDTRTLDYNISLIPKRSLPAAVKILLRETEAVNISILESLSSIRGKATVNYCHLEDEQSTIRLFAWHTDTTPLKSRSAKLAYFVSLLLLALGWLLVDRQLQLDPYEGREFNIVTLILTIGIAVSAILLPFVFAHIERRRNRWQLAYDGGN